MKSCLRLAITTAERFNAATLEVFGGDGRPDQDSEITYSDAPL